MSNHESDRRDSERVHRFLDERGRRKYDDNVDRINASLDGGGVQMLLALVVIAGAVLFIYVGFFA